MKVLVTGVKGQLGHDVVEELIKRGDEPIGVDVEEMDITDKTAVNKVIKEVMPDVIVHCAAWTAVDLAEDDDKKEKVFDRNTPGKHFHNFAQPRAQHGKGQNSDRHAEHDQKISGYIPVESPHIFLFQKV